MLGKYKRKKDEIHEPAIKQLRANQSSYDYLNKYMKNKQGTNKKAPLMELRSYLRVGIKLMMTTTMPLLNQIKGDDAISKHITSQFTETQTFTQ